MNFDLLKEELIRDEGLRLKPYRCTAGKLTIGVGRNLDDVGISASEAAYLLQHDIDRVLAELNLRLPWWAGLSENRQRALVNFTFNVGIGTVLTFKRTLALLQDGKYEEAADEMLNSKWAKQVGTRSKRVTDMIRKG